MFPDAEISLGCMRPRAHQLRQAIEAAALKGGATRIELPSRTIIQNAALFGFTSIVNYDACCALPDNLESHARSKRSVEGFRECYSFLTLTANWLTTTAFDTHCVSATHGVEPVASSAVLHIQDYPKDSSFHLDH